MLPDSQFSPGFCQSLAILSICTTRLLKLTSCLTVRAKLKAAVDDAFSVPLKVWSLPRFGRRWDLKWTLYGSRSTDSRESESADQDCDSFWET